MTTPTHNPSQFAFLRRAEGAAICAVATYLFALGSGDWALFALLFLAPDLGMLGYLRGARVGALVYNAFHTYLAPAVLGLAGLALQEQVLCVSALIWAAHIGFDRALGYGLKRATNFHDTHLSEA